MNQLKKFGYVLGDEYCDCVDYVTEDDIITIFANGHVELRKPSKGRYYKTTVDVLKAIIDEHASYWNLAEFLGIKESDLVSVAFLPHEGRNDRELYRVRKTSDINNEPLLVLENINKHDIRGINILRNHPYYIIKGENK